MPLSTKRRSITVGETLRVRPITTKQIKQKLDHFRERNFCAISRNLDLPDKIHSQRMHDFCFTIPYGLVLVGGGIFGYFMKGSVASLGGGVGVGLVLILAGYLSLEAFKKRKNSYPAVILETICAATLTWVMGQRYLQTSKIMPAGIVAGISALMTVFYLYKIASGGNHFPTKAE